MDVISGLNKLLGDPNQKELKKLWPVVKQVKDRIQQDDIRALTLDDLPKKTEEFKKAVEGGKSVDDLLVDAFAVAYRACELLQGKSIQIGKQIFIWNMVPFDVQILGGIALHKGSISEMKTGEGKTLVCTLPLYLNALAGKGAHLVTVNDYLAKRDSAWMGLLYQALGLTVGCVVHGLNSEERKKAYGSDITYGTNNEFGFDYLRDNMANSVARQVQRGLHYAIVDEVDSILIDEARTPLIISQPAGESTAKYGLYAGYVRELQDQIHFIRDEKQRTATLTDEGIKKMEQILGVSNIYTEKGFEEVHHIEQALRAHAIYKLDVDYVVKDGEIIIVDEFTGRLMPGRRYGHGLHQAIEAKEHVEVQRESKTLATITFQNYFRLYTKLAGMTGTAKTEEEEFESIYKLRTIVIPTHRPVTRQDKSDAIYRTVEAKFRAVANIAQEKHAKGQPVLIGTTSIEKSEAMSALLTEMKIEHTVLNAKQHEKEADIVALAGKKGAVTIATNMAGRGTDIKLEDGVQALGGLAILGTERHESRRIDNQLRGRSGRQGDPGESQFFVSMDDDLMRLFGGDRLKSMMEKLKVPDDVPLENRIVSRSIESAQKKVEGHHFDIRRHVVQYDDVMNKHREIMYKRRQKILERIAEAEKNPEETENVLHEDVLTAIRAEAQAIVNLTAQERDQEFWRIDDMHAALSGIHPELTRLLPADTLRSAKDPDALSTLIADELIRFYEKKCSEMDPKTVAQAERLLVLRSIDVHWMDHIDTMAHLREQVAFSGYAQRDPLIEYKDQGFKLFRQLLAQIDATIVKSLFQIDFTQFAPQQILAEEEVELKGTQTNEAEIEGALTETGAEDEARVLKGQRPRGQNQRPIDISKIGRNDPCPCGSGKKFKKCHGKEL